MIQNIIFLQVKLYTIITCVLEYSYYWFLQQITFLLQQIHSKCNEIFKLFRIATV